MVKVKVLYIEDNFSSMFLIKNVLGAEGYEVIGAETGREGLAKAIEDKPDIIITDIELPDIDGYEIIEILKKNGETAHIPVIAMTVHMTNMDRKNAFEAGCDGYIPKPIDVEDLPGQLESILKDRKWE